MSDYKKGQKVYIRDYPFGHPLNVVGEVVAVLGNDYYNVLLKSGLLEGKIKKYKYWPLFPLDEDKLL